jgi:hypothetical protein
MAPKRHVLRIHYIVSLLVLEKSLIIIIPLMREDTVPHNIGILAINIMSCINAFYERN